MFTSTTEASTTRPEKVQKIFNVIGLTAGFALALLWYFRGPDYEPLLAMVATAAPLVAMLVIHGNRGVILGVGIIVGCLIVMAVALAWSNNQIKEVDDPEQMLALSSAPREWRKFTVSMSKPDFHERIERFLAQAKPQFGGIQAGLCEGTDFYLWARRDGDGPAWKLKSISLNEDDWRDVIEELALQRRVTLIGFTSGPQAALWYLEAQ